MTFGFIAFCVFTRLINLTLGFKTFAPLDCNKNVTD